MHQNPSLKKEFNFFINNLPELLKKYQGKYIVIKNEQILGAYESFEQAILATRETEKIGTFLVQKCEANKDSYTATYHSRVSFTH